MEKLTGHNFDSLEPRAQPYEVRAEIDMALRIFPNGSKTWVYIYCDSDGVQRETLGVYPDMDINQAYQALLSVRETAAKLHKKPPEDGEVAQENIEQPPAKSGRAGLWSVISVSGLVALLVGAYNYPTESMEKFVSIDTPVVMQTETAAIQLPEISSSVGEAEVESLVEEVESAVVVTTELPAPLMAEIEILEVEPMVSDEIPIEVVAIDPSGVVALEREPQVVEVDDRVIEDNIEPLSEISSPTQEESQLPVQLAANSVIDDVEEVILPTGLVKRAQFTSGIKDREPVDQIEPFAVEDEKDFMQLYFFTEVTKLAGRTIYHRWELNGEVLAEVPFEVKSAWRWRVFSSKQILATMQGEWQVSVVDDLGNTLHLEQFSTAPTSVEAEDEVEEVALLLQ